MTESADGFHSLPDEYKKVLQLARDRHKIKVTPLQELKGGQTGAVLYLVSVSDPGSKKVQHLVLKLDHKASKSRMDELTRHRDAVDKAPPEFSENHIAEVAFERVETEDSMAIFYNIAGQSLNNYRSLASYQQQNKLENIFSLTSKILLTKWNASPAFNQAVHPQIVLSSWLGYRLNPGGNIEQFLESFCNIPNNTQGLLVQGHVFPNPLFYSRQKDTWGKVRPIDNIIGFQHGDLNIGNILSKFDENDSELKGYYLIDFALFKADMPLFYDNCYLEMSYLLRETARTNFSKWIDLITRFSEQDILNPYQVPIEFSGVISVINSGRRFFKDWIQKNHSSLSDDLWGQYWLAAVAAGLNYCNKSIISDQERLAGLIFAAAHLKRYHSVFGLPLPVEVKHIDTSGKPDESNEINKTIIQQSIVPKNNLPAQTTPFIGRQKELSEIIDLTLRENVRLITFTGPGGTGKTRLGLQAARQLVTSFKDGIFFVDLSAVKDAESLFAGITRTIGFRKTSDQSLLDELRKHLRDKRMMLLLDNFEQLTSAAPEVGELLRDCPHLKFIVTSREPLHVRGEQIYPVPPLTLPGTAIKSLSIEQIKENEAVQMFLDRAKTVRPDFELTNDDFQVVAEICARLDGLPLAIELAAARISLFSPAALLERMGSRLKILKGGARDLPARQQTLRDTIKWSYEMLNEEDQLLFALLSIFPSCTFDQVEAVTKNISTMNNSQLDIYSSLSSLVDKSLIRRSDQGKGESRLSMLETIREYASGRLEENEALSSAACESHAKYFAEFSQQQQKRLTGHDRESALSEFESEIENMRSAWKYWVDKGELEQLQKLTDSLWVLFDAKGWYHDTLALTNDLLKVLSSNPSEPEYAKQEIMLQMSLARVLMTIKGCTPEVEETYNRALELCQKHGEIPQSFAVLRSLASFYVYLADFGKSIQLGERILELAGEMNNVSMKIEGHLLLGYSLVFSGSLEPGMEHLGKAVEEFKPGLHDSHKFRFGNNPGIISYTTSAICLWMMGFPDRSQKLADDAAALAERINHLSSKAYVNFHTGLLHLWRLEPELALKKAETVLEISKKNEFQIWKAVAASLHGAVLVVLGKTEEGLREIEYGTNMYTELKTPPVFWPLLLSVRAVTCMLAERPQEGLQYIEEALDIIGEKSENPILAEFFRLKGEVLIMISTEKISEAESLFKLAVEISDKQKTKMFELRAAMSLFRLLQGKGKTEEGRQILNRAYKKFTEGYQTVDLLEAQRLLA